MGDMKDQSQSNFEGLYIGVRIVHFIGKGIYKDVITFPSRISVVKWPSYFVIEEAIKMLKSKVIKLQFFTERINGFRALKVSSVFMRET